MQEEKDKETIEKVSTRKLDTLEVLRKSTTFGDSKQWGASFLVHALLMALVVFVLVRSDSWWPCPAILTDGSDAGVAIGNGTKPASN